MRRRIFNVVVGYVYRALRRGNPGPALRMFTTDGRLVFAGDSSWSIDTTEPAARAEWFQRFSAARPNLQICDLVISGAPWRTSACVVFEDSFRDDSGATIYSNRGVQYLRLRWLRICHDEIVLDTQRVAAYDDRTRSVGGPTP